MTRVPGMNLVSATPGRSRLVLRGLNAGGVSATIGTYVDETPYGSVTGLANGAVLAPDLDTYDMQRVEVLRGPQGTLYGASSLGGLLKFVTNAPDPGKFAARAEGSVEDTKSASTGGSIKGLLNIPLSAMAAVRVSAFYSDQPGFIDDPVRNATNVNGAKLYGGRISGLLKPTDKLSVRVSAVTQTIDSKGANDGGRQPPHPGTAAWRPHAEPDVFRARQGHLRHLHPDRRLRLRPGEPALGDQLRNPAPGLERRRARPSSARP